MKVGIFIKASGRAEIFRRRDEGEPAETIAEFPSEEAAKRYAEMEFELPVDRWREVWSG